MFDYSEDGTPDATTLPELLLHIEATFSRTPTKLAVYANDTTLYTLSRNDALMCRRMQIFFDEWRLEID